MIRLYGCALIAAALVMACGSPDRVIGPVSGTPGDPTSPPDADRPSTPGKVEWLDLQVDTLFAFPMQRGSFYARGYTSQGAVSLYGSQVQVTVSDTSVARVEALETYPAVDAASASDSAIRLIVGRIHFQAEGTTTLTMRADTASASVTLHVRPEPPLTSALVVDSFTVVEYPVQCAWNCMYLAYSPLLMLREPNGASADVIGVEVSVPTMTTGVCVGTRHFAPGQVAWLWGVDPYIYNNDLVFIRSDGVPVPDGTPTARVFVRDAEGNYGRIDVSGSIQRMVRDPQFPESPWSSSC